MTPSLGLINLLEWLIELSETVTFTSLLEAMTKDTGKQLDEEIHRAKSERVPSREASVLMKSTDVTLPVCVRQSGNSKTHSIGIFMEVLSHK